MIPFNFPARTVAENRVRYAESSMPNYQLRYIQYRTIETPRRSKKPCGPKFVPELLCLISPRVMSTSCKIPNAISHLIIAFRPTCQQTRYNPKTCTTLKQSSRYPLIINHSTNQPSTPLIIMPSTHQPSTTLITKQALHSSSRAPLARQ